MISTQRLVRVVPTVIRANYPFRRFKPESNHEVRKPDVTGTEIDQLRARRNMLRSMTTEQLLQLEMDIREPMNLFEALALAKRESKLIVPNDIYYRALEAIQDENRPNYLKPHPPYGAWTGTLVIYESSDKPFGNDILFIREYDTVQNTKARYSISFTIPEQFRGKKNCGLVLEHPDFEIIGLGDNKFQLTLANGANIRLVEPKGDEWINRWHDTYPKKKTRWFKRLTSWYRPDCYIGCAGRFVIDGNKHVISDYGGWPHASPVALF